MSKKKFALITVGALVVIGLCVGLGKYVYGKKHSVVHETGSQNTKGETGSSTSGTSTGVTKPSGTGSPIDSSSSSSPQPGDQKNGAGGDSTSNLLDPSGDFVSAHGKATDPIPSSATLTSVCNTTPGASCKITFTSSTGVVKSLPSQTTDRGGSTYWDGWKLKTYGIGAGTWKVQAIASLNGQIKTADDALALEVSE